MHATTVAVDLAKSVFQVAVADDTWKVVERHRLTRLQFERWFQNRNIGLVIMEACGSAIIGRAGSRAWGSRPGCCPRRTSELT